MIDETRGTAVDSTYGPISVIPATRTPTSGNLTGTRRLIPLRGLSAMNCPTNGRSRTTGILCDERDDSGPNPLSSKSCGLPIAPALRITSPPLFTCTSCCVPLESWYLTPTAAT
ncbi:hypothetical protein Hanom_Chr09g00779971 [Helianthus anomalus]